MPKSKKMPADNDNEAFMAMLERSSREDLARDLFEMTWPADGTADLTQYRVMADHDLVNGLMDEAICGYCKSVLLERMAATGFDDFVMYVLKIKP
jgi:hypothetical protein